MKLKTHKRRKRLCPVFRRRAKDLIRIGMLWTVWMSLSIMVGMSPDRHAGWVLAGVVTVTIGYVLGRTVRYLEKRGMFFRRITKKSACKRRQP
ncbi:hypothetical protein [Sporofaciens sp. JLR.KK001]|uniref:hypothetical protein n=1 Tax=Sporofaciens sp. JLR.KK001 TaxID=3112621 RepID=UPI002FEF0086